MLPARRAMLLCKQHDEERERIAERAREHEARRVNNGWLLSSDARNVRHTVRRDVDDIMMQHRFSVHQRQQRLRELLEEEERQLVLAARLEHDSPQTRQKQMRERAKSLQEAREAQRKQVAAEKLDLLFRDQCQELREAQSKRRLLKICEERRAQLRGQQEDARRRQCEDDMFHQLWQADASAKEERERREAAEAHRCGQMQKDFLCQQMAETERLRQRELLARQEEARQQEEKVRLLQKQAELKHRLEQDALTARRRLLDESLRLKTDRVAREQQEALQIELGILRQTLKEETQAQQETADKRAEMREQQIRFHQYVTETTMQRKKDEEEIEQMMAEHQQEARDRQDQRTQLQQEARERLMKEVLECRRLQAAQKEERDSRRRADMAKERVEMDAAVRDMKRADEELAKRQHRAFMAYQTELQAQIEQRRREHQEREDEELREQHKLQQMEQEKQEKKDEVLARPHDGILHPFRKAAIFQEQQ
ncbi:cilia- and flagella-associated protein 53 [Vanacampus margaritifer]